jgi:hypothetical protein
MCNEEKYKFPQDAFKHTHTRSHRGRRINSERERKLLNFDIIFVRKKIVSLLVESERGKGLKCLLRSM